MTTPCHPIPASLAQHYLAQTKAALCDRPGESAAENAERTKRMVHTAMGFEPRDGMEYMLATLVQAQYEVILKATKDALQGTEDAASPKAISALAAMNRVMLSTIRALKTARERPLAEDEDAPRNPNPSTPSPRRRPAPPGRAPCRHRLCPTGRQSHPSPASRARRNPLSTPRRKPPDVSLKQQT